MEALPAWSRQGGPGTKEEETQQRSDAPPTVWPGSGWGRNGLGFIWRLLSHSAVTN